MGEIDRCKRHCATQTVPAGALVVHGELDESAPLAAVLDWARPQSLPIVVVPGADHFFIVKLPLQRSLAVAHMRHAMPGDDH